MLGSSLVLLSAWQKHSTLQHVPSVVLILKQLQELFFGRMEKTLAEI
jgi:hypothetical protein